MEKLKIIFSPSKNVYKNDEIKNIGKSIPHFKKETDFLVKHLQKCSDSELNNILKTSFQLFEENKFRYEKWDIEKDLNPAIYLFKGEAFKFLDVRSFNKEEIIYLQEHLFILSGLYGILKPLDLIKPYRLEMASKLNKEIFNFSNLYEFWKNRITDFIRSQEINVIINLASEEYSKVVDFNNLKCKVIKPIFMEYKKNKLSVVSIYSKQARGEMLKFIVKNKIKNFKEIILFNSLSYNYVEKLSDENNYVFVR